MKVYVPKLLLLFFYLSQFHLVIRGYFRLEFQTLFQHVIRIVR